MESPNSSPDQEKGEQQPSELLILSDKDNNGEPSDHVPPLPSPSQHEEETRRTLATEPFQPTLKALADLERDDPKFAFPAARLVGLYRRLWESCVSKHIDGQKLQQSNQTLKEAGASLRKERDGLQLYHEKQLARLRFFEQALESSRERLTRVLDGWNHPSRLNLAETPDIEKQE
ncbi:hypothetical protein BDV29DRAFT_163884 [Aspergillus leporis]|uniref:Uncharacterized protein n=1 Tax=Aspergillus leporis TaxID=41062 RepID=A0A5N5WFP1_9EURO|nr:hypothetical protein BDV29DRAFT_163884 [Aspergillus leporis]